MNLNPHETATVLAALRYWQQDHQREMHEAQAEGREPIIYGEHFRDVNPLGLAEIDDLCERINSDHLPLVVISGGICQNGMGNDAVDILDFDGFEWGQSDEEARMSWDALSDRAKQYVRDNDPDIAIRCEKEPL